MPSPKDSASITGTTAGCHANGGGGIGPPPIRKDQRDWIYGGEPSNVFDTIVKGRPNGMPTWGGKIPGIPNLADCYVCALAE